MPLLSGARILIDSLAREGAEVIFGYPGGVTLPIYDVLYDHPLRHVLVRHEENASFAAEGFARTTGKVGVCMATSGPGATNLTTGLVDALMDSIPIVAITGQVPSKLIGRDAFQEADTFGITRAATKHNYLVKDINELAQVIHEAFYVAISGRPGPVLVDVTKDVLTGKANYHPADKMEPLRGYELRLDPDEAEIEQAVEFCWNAERPYIYAGGGVISAGASEELRKFAELLEAPVALTVMGLGAMPSNHPNFISMLGMHGSYAANMGVTETDALFAVGVRFDDRVTGRLDAFAPNAQVLHVDIDAAEINKNRRADVGVVGDARRVLEKLNRRLAETKAQRGPQNREARAAWMEQIHAWKRKHPFQYEHTAQEIKPQYLMQKIDEVSGGEGVVTVDVGQHQMWAAQYIRIDHPRRWSSSSGLGSMGFGLPAAMGAQFGNPDKLCIALVGDGGFMMSLSELSTIASNRLPLKIIVMNNGSLGMVRQWQELFYNRRYCAVAMDSFPNVELLAASFGIKGRSVEKPSELDAALKEAIEEPGPYLLNVHVSPEENVYPMVPAGGAVNEMILQPPKPVAVGD
jgi:acetolactate synthase I/II/III large subunit